MTSFLQLDSDLRNDGGVEDKMAKKAMLKNDFYRSVPRCGVERRIERERERERE